MENGNERAVLQFWFEEITPKQWWKKDAAFDQQIYDRFAALHAACHAGECVAWRESDDGRLAEIILLDQFPRNMYRDSARAFASDGIALVLAQEAVRAGAHQRLSDDRVSFLLMPYMHSESRRIHESAVSLFSSINRPEALDFELRHKAIIDEFGRYPHRNALLGRASTPAELAFLEGPGSSF